LRNCGGENFLEKRGFRCLEKTKRKEKLWIGIRGGSRGPMMRMRASGRLRRGESLLKRNE